MEPVNYTVKEIQQLLHIGQVSAYRLVRSGVFPVIKIGRSYRIPQDTFQTWMHSGCGLPAETNPIDHDACILNLLKNGGIGHERNR